MNVRLSRSLILPLVFVLSLPAVTTRLYASDEIEFFAWLRSFAFDRDADFQNEYQYFYDTGVAKNALFHETFLERVNENGRRINFTPIGCAVLWAPFYAGGHLVARVTGAPADGFSSPYIAAVTYGSAVYGLLALVLSAAIARRLAGESLGATIAIWIGTPLVFYMYVAPGFSHAASAFAVSLFLWTWLRIRDRWTPGGALLLGTTGALMAMVREQDLFFVAGPAVDFLLNVRRTQASAARPAHAWVVTAIAGVLATAIAYTPQLLAYQALHGHPGPAEMVGRKMTWTSPHGWAVLFSPEHGLFFWSPLALMAIAGLVWLVATRTPTAIPAHARRIGALMLLMFALQAYIAGCVESWTVSGAFGQRRFVALTPILVAGLAVLLARTAAGGPAIRWVTRGAIVLAIWWHLGLLLQFSLNEMDRKRLTLRANAYATFVDLPGRAPGILWQYLTNRSAFYGRPPQ